MGCHRCPWAVEGGLGHRSVSLSWSPLKGSGVSSDRRGQLCPRVAPALPLALSLSLSRSSLSWLLHRPCHGCSPVTWRPQRGDRVTSRPPGGPREGGQSHTTPPYATVHRGGPRGGHGHTAPPNPTVHHGGHSHTTPPQCPICCGGPRGGTVTPHSPMPPWGWHVVTSHPPNTTMSPAA